ncbi:uncharacterized protein B0I36DRAFT_330090 [Microdochium trichocladiopsis]|uniref:Uncharacterized protein n=1 Tax=Microdochium trichocladiopsis TaxID=1682393 RepID=A0A9P9BMT1_9PEZI|nr:uncharacterized protein B0I36DRAFT_330090 [Microdochium trichocladiopsis]KAH7026201.1 hypothetical protein B0I36DRAFT_330090 [Microdochium trichocladiopsis]
MPSTLPKGSDLDRGWPYARIYYLSSTHSEKQQTVGSGEIKSSSVEEEPLWVAELTVFFEECSDINLFRPARELKKNGISFACAYSTRPDSDIVEELYYEYDHQDPEDAFNILFDDMPLPGWWPWPKERTS